MQTTQTPDLNWSLILAIPARMKLKPLTLLDDRLWVFAPSAQVRYMKMVCAICARTIRGQPSLVTLKLARLFFNKKFLLNKFRNY